MKGFPIFSCHNFLTQLANFIVFLTIKCYHAPIARIPSIICKTLVRSIIPRLEVVHRQYWGYGGAIIAGPLSQMRDIDDNWAAIFSPGECSFSGLYWTVWLYHWTLHHIVPSFMGLKQHRWERLHFKTWEMFQKAMTEYACNKFGIETYTLSRSKLITMHWLCNGSYIPCPLVFVNVKLTHTISKVRAFVMAVLIDQSI